MNTQQRTIETLRQNAPPKVYDRAVEILQNRVNKRAEEIACKYVLAELGRGMSFLK